MRPPAAPSSPSSERRRHERPLSGITVPDVSKLLPVPLTAGLRDDTIAKAAPALGADNTAYLGD